MFANPSADAIARLLRGAHTVAIVGLSPDRTRPPASTSTSSMCSAAPSTLRKSSRNACASSSRSRDRAALR
jgi:hypothetical protein